MSTKKKVSIKVKQLTKPLEPGSVDYLFGCGLQKPKTLEDMINLHLSL